MDNLRFVNIDKNAFDIIINNKNHCIGVVEGRGDDVDFITLERFNNFFIIKSLDIDIEHIFDNQYLPIDLNSGDYVVLTQEGGYDWLDDIDRRTTLLIDDAHHFQGGPDSPRVSFYEYSVLTPDYFFYEGADNGK
ncbi:hypothetical protein [Xenorhabdus kozodoii]|uniref:Uncharacterized protein n=1 Tax=Xenorhabdus kozodoii TaxID=351676 RepID=A0A2D0LDE4_9GAMM|nr:hypothetical protein [Xenorhabdus kozodoii]PHM73692.1 hypothetical protein Xkoz_01513 [Xenorhabdus kozodoii]